MGLQNMTKDILTTIICIVSILNRRILSSISDDIYSYEAVNLNHFLIGSSESEVFRMFSKEYDGHRKSFKAAQTNFQQIWRRFQKKYIPMHLARNKSFKDQKTQFQEDDLVWILDPQTVFTDKFPLGRIIKHDMQKLKQN